VPALPARAEHCSANGDHLYEPECDLLFAAQRRAKVMRSTCELGGGAPALFMTTEVVARILPL
jgi:hypothetical protein